MPRKTKNTDQPGDAPARPPVDLSTISVTTDLSRVDMARHRRTRTARDDDQKAIDAIVEAAWKAWVEAGRPADWVDQPGRLIAAPAEAWETIVFLVQKAGRFYSLKIKFGDVDTFDKDGVTYSEAVFTATERPAGEQSDATLPDGEQDGDQSGDQPGDQSGDQSGEQDGDQPEE